MKIVHLTVVRQLTMGQTKQLRFEHDAAATLQGGSWRTLAYHNGPLTEPYMRRIPAPFRLLFLRNLWGWLVALRLSRTHDIVMMRHMTFDPFAFIFAPLVRNRVSVHHAKEVEELRLIRKGWTGRAASWLERVSGRFAVSRTGMIFGVTQEIAAYERDLHAPEKPIGVYPNGVDVAQIPILADKRDPDRIHAGFICGAFSSWHGLDKLIAAVDAHQPQADDLPLTIHLIGKLSDTQASEVNATAVRRRVFKMHGILRDSEYRPILEMCDVGIASLAMERQNLREGSTLKVREMLAMGLPIYSGHQDMVLSEKLGHAQIVESVSYDTLLYFGLKAKCLDRGSVREDSKKGIDKAECMFSVQAETKAILSSPNFQGGNNASI